MDVLLRAGWSSPLTRVVDVAVECAVSSPPLDSHEVRVCAYTDAVSRVPVADVDVLGAGDMSGCVPADVLKTVLGVERCDVALRVLDTAGFFELVAPEVAALEQQGRVAGSGTALHKDNLAHSFLVAAQCPVRLRVRVAALCHDVGKPSTRRIVDGEVSFRDHERVGALITGPMLRRLGFDDGFAGEVSQLVGSSARVADFDDAVWSDSAVRRVVTDLGVLLDDLVALTRADSTSRHRGVRDRVVRAADGFCDRAARVAAADAERARRPALDGVEIAALLGVEPGPVVGEAWRMLRDAAAADARFSDPEAARLLLVDWWRERPGSG